MAHSAPTQESFLVIGGGTSLGENIVEQLLNRGETRVSIFDAQPLVAEQTARFGALSVCVGDILVPETIADAVKSVRPPNRYLLPHSLTYPFFQCAATCIIHTGMVSTPIGTTSRYPTPLQPAANPKTLEKHLKDFKELHRKVSTDGMRNVLAAALEGGVTQLLYVSSTG
jgi:nucleoside-diphosphate-sugar epimerase